jgi:predicted TIM-barrel fold metal-dependent hydrolase
MKPLRHLFVIACLVCVPCFPVLADGPIPIVDAHSQLPAPATADKVIALMDEAGVARTILSFRGSARGGDVQRLAEQYPDRLTAAIKTKGKHWPRGNDKFYRQIEKQLATGQYGALGEVLYYHAAKGDKAPEWTVLPTDQQAVYLLEVARDHGWPLVVHIEFAALGSEKDTWMQRLETLLSSNPDMNFPMIHMGQLEAQDVARLLMIHPNIFFMVSHSNTVTVSQSNQPWVNLFAGEELKPAWKDLIIQHPDRFVLNFDNVFEEHWGPYYLEQVALWRKTLQQLPADVAHAIAHGNAERLWHLPPAKQTRI